MVSFPNCKLNLGLRVLRRRPDGFHDLDTVFYPLPFHDILEVIGSPGGPGFSFTTSGLPMEGDPETNLCVRAYRLLKKDFPSLPPLQMHLHKVIPMGAGLGGGSADGAFALRLISRKFLPGIPEEKLRDYALSLGSDGPFFILNRPCHANGRGEILTPVEINLDGYDIVLVNPGIHISTKIAFSKINPSLPGKSSAEIISQPIESWKEELLNDFEKPVLGEYPAIAEIKDALYGAGALYASMSGSGSTVYGIFKNRIETPLSFPEEYFVKTLAGQRD